MRTSTYFLLTVLVMVAIPAVALHSDEDVIGFYFDAQAESNCLETAPYVTVPLHLVLTNPAMEAICGYEFGYSVSGNYMVSGTTLMGFSPIDVGGGQGNHIVGLAAPLTPHGATVLVTLSVFVMDDKQIQFDLHGANPASITDHPELPVLALGNGTMQNPVLSSPEGVSSAKINGSCNPETDISSWDGVKSLYQ
ncbi:MAG: hypothetical protein KOO60_03470 [Gemmatimonadales bacterium]|nr:hypothetical protein [Gemmatimonadales bacterium]